MTTAKTLIRFLVVPPFSRVFEGGRLIVDIGAWNTVPPPPREEYDPKPHWQVIARLQDGTGHPEIVVPLSREYDSEADIQADMHNGLLLLSDNSSLDQTRQKIVEEMLRMKLVERARSRPTANPAGQPRQVSFSRSHRPFGAGVLPMPASGSGPSAVILSNGFGIRCRIGTGNPIVIDELDRCAGILERLREKAVEFLSVSARKNAITSFFTFPPAVKAACEQYLVYFIQFLEDLGIKAEAEIKEDARRVLFSVFPADGPSALEKVREALEVYLRLPGMPNLGASAGEYPDLAVQQLHANVLHLQSQLMLARVTLQAQDATIEALRFSNFQYRQLISSEEKPRAKTEPLLGDTIHVTKVEGKGLSIDLPLILKRMKRVFGIGRQIDT